ncbi:MAG: discoidin domain-containing protein [Bacteroidota bacterium]
MRYIFSTTAVLFALISFSRAQVVQVSVDAGSVIRDVNPLLYGINTARWDESLFPGPANEMLLTNDRDAIRKIKASGVTLLKYPGGNDADHYIWNSKENSESEMDTDEYLALCREVGAEPFITINFNESPQLAADWVRYCNITRGFNVKYWEVGDEQWGSWAKGHSSPEGYAKRYAEFVTAMKAVDPTIKVATNVALSGNAPSLGGGSEGWTARVLRAVPEHIDMLTITFYPQQWGKENDAELLKSVDVYRKLFLQLKDEVKRVAGEKKAEEIIYINVGYNSVNHSPGPQTLQIVNALWVADMIGAMAEVGTDIACYWAVHNAFPPRKGDYGYLSSEGSNTPNVNYYVFPMFARHFGSTMVKARSSDKEVAVYAATAGKKLSLFIINKSKTKEKRLSIVLDKFTPDKNAKVRILDSVRMNEELPMITAADKRFSYSVPPFSLIAMEFISSDSIVPPSNLAHSAIPTASSYSVIGPHFSAASAVDGKTYTRWNSAAWTKSDGKEEQWYQLEWKTPQTFTDVQIHWGETRAVNYILEISDDGKEWTPLREITDGKGKSDEFTFAPVSARFLRMNGTLGTGGRWTISAYSIREIEVFLK